MCPAKRNTLTGHFCASLCPFRQLAFLSAKRILKASFRLNTVHFYAHFHAVGHKLHKVFNRSTV